MATSQDRRLARIAAAERMRAAEREFARQAEARAEFEEAAEAFRRRQVKGLQGATQ